MSKRFPVAASVRVALCAVAAAVAVGVSGCKKDQVAEPASTQPTPNSTSVAIHNVPVVQPAVGFQQRSGEEIVIAGHFYRIGTRVVTWMDPGGYDSYRVERHFGPYEKAGYENRVYNDLTVAAATTRKAEHDRTTRPTSFPTTGPATSGVIDNPVYYGLRYGDSDAIDKLATTRPELLDTSHYASPTTRPLTPAQLQQVRNGGWPLDLLQQKVDQFVVHYDVDGTSMHCFQTLHDSRGLSVQFMLDLDGTIYQTLDVKERAWQATKANSRSIGIEIANVGAYGSGDGTPPFATWYKKDANGLTYITIPPRYGGYEMQYTHPAILRPIRNDPVVGTIGKLQENGTFKPFRCRQYDLTPQQYAALPKLIAALCDAFPNIKCDCPRNPDGTPLLRTLKPDEYNVFQGVLGHFHVQTEKTDPGPAFQWDKVIHEAQQLLAERKRAEMVSR